MVEAFIKTRLPLNFDKQSSFLIIQNDTDTHHMERQLFPLLKSVGMYPKYGLSNCGNLHVWIYHAFGGHNAQEDPFLCMQIQQIAASLYPGRDSDLESLDSLCISISELWARTTWDRHRLATGIK